MKPYNRKIIISIGLLFSIISCSMSSPPTVKTPGYTVLSQGQQSGFTLQKTLLLENAGEFSELWAIHTGGSKTPVPIINFKNTIVVANFLGEQSTGGYSITVDSVVTTAKYTQVTFTTHRPIPGSMRTMQITQPYIMIKLDKTKQPIYFEYNREY